MRFPEWWRKLKTSSHLEIEPTVRAPQNELPPETEFLRLSARRSLDPSDASSLLRLLNTDLDWWWVLREGQRHGLLPLVHDCLARRWWLDMLPPQPRTALVAAARMVAAHSLWLTGELLRILRAFAEESIPALPFKGPVVAVEAYGEIALRSFADLDILVPQSDLADAQQALERLGYEPVVALTPQQERAYLQSECALQYRHPARSQIVELHWRFSERHASIDLPMANVWERAGHLNLAGTMVRTLSPEDLVLYLCIHGAKHQWERFEWVCCLAEVIRNRPEIRWNLVCESARRHGVLRILRLGLRLAAELCGARIPSPAGQGIGSDRVTEGLLSWVMASLFAKPQEASHYQARALRYRFMLQVRERWSDRVLILMHSAFKPPHPEADEWFQLPPGLAFLHHVLRPVRLAGQYGAVAWRHYLR